MLQENDQMSVRSAPLPLLVPKFSSIAAPGTFSTMDFPSGSRPVTSKREVFQVGPILMGWSLRVCGILGKPGIHEMNGRTMGWFMMLTQVFFHWFGMKIMIPIKQNMQIETLALNHQFRELLAMCQNWLENVYIHLMVGENRVSQFVDHYNPQHIRGID